MKALPEISTQSFIEGALREHTGPLTIFGIKGVPPFPKFGQRGYPIFPTLVKGCTPFSQLWEKMVTSFPKFGQRGYPIFPTLVNRGTPFSQLWKKMVTSFPKFGLKMVLLKEVILFFHISKKREGTIQVSCDNFIGREG